MYLGVLFDGTFTWCLSGLCHALEFEEAWHKAVDVCKDIEDISGPLPETPLGLYRSSWGNEYRFSRLDSGEYVIEFPDTTSLRVDEIQRREVELGHYPADRLLEVE